MYLTIQIAGVYIGCTYHLQMDHTQHHMNTVENKSESPEPTTNSAAGNSEESKTQFPDSPVRLYNTSLLFISIILGLFVLHFAKSIFIPLIMAIMFSYALKPIVNRLVRFGLPHSLAAAALLVALVGGTGFAAYTVSDDGLALLDMLPKVAQDLRKTLIESRKSGKSGPANAIEKVQKAARLIALIVSGVVRSQGWCRPRA